MNYSVNDKVSWNEFKVLTVQKESPNTIFYKTSFSEKQYNVIHIRRKTRTKGEEILLIPAYNAAKKKNDLISLCEQNLIRKKQHFFFIPLKGNMISNNDNWDSE